MTHTLRTLCLALMVGILAGAGAATYVRGVDAHSKIGLEFNAGNGRQHVELDHLGPADATGRPPRFWGLKVGTGDSLTAIGVYSGRPGASTTPIASTPTAKSSLRLPE